MPDPLAWIDDELERLGREGLLRERRVGLGLDPRAPAGDLRERPPLVNFGSNDYLGLARDPRLAAAAAAAAAGGWGAGASPVVGGRSPHHAELERRLAEFEGQPSALVFPSGFAANAGVVPALVDQGDAIYADAKNHASLIDGCRLSRANRYVYPHADAAALGRMLAGGQQYRRRLIVTDTLFSMDGDVAPLVELAELAERHGAMLLVDEAHATGVWGPTGRGAVELAAARDPRVERLVSVRVGTLSKAFGASGGFVSGSEALIRWLVNRARPYVFSTASPPAAAAAALAGLEAARAEPWRRARVIALAERVQAALTEAGWDTGHSTTQVVPIRVGGPAAAVALSERLARAGVAAPAIRPPSVPEGESLVRLSLSAAHSDDDVQRLLQALGPAR
ncbi:MAG: aminotransferase class I/II-fold pyridoxal phosphate-dependent enzyme [Lacipirellulaceae bacterium]